jgi:hypothetical protein
MLLSVSTPISHLDSLELNASYPTSATELHIVGFVVPRLIEATLTPGDRFSEMISRPRQIPPLNVGSTGRMTESPH